jgi:NAD-dependent SIR2 family protein deacetylase
MTNENQPDRVDRNVYILGAGFSADAGAPMIHGFLDQARLLLDDPSSGLDSVERDHFGRVFEFRRKMAQAREKVRIDLDDMEQLFGLVEMSQRFGNELPETRNSTVYLIAKTLQLTIESGRLKRGKYSLPVPAGGAEEIDNYFKKASGTGSYGIDLQNVDEYDYFIGLITGAFDPKAKRKHRKDTIITFNYDLVCESALSRLGCAANYHLPPEVVNDQRATTPEKSCDLLKLHGSTNWGVCSACSNRVVILSEKVTGSPSEFRALTCECGRKQFNPLLIPPSWDKSEYREIIASVWRKAAAELSAATRICIIGYSMPETDSFFKYLLTMALARNHQLYKLIVVDYLDKRSHLANQPHKSHLHARYESLLESMFLTRRFRFFDDGLDRFLVHHYSREHLGRGELLVKTSLT